MARVVVAADDFFFASKIKEAARHAGVEVAFVDTAAALLMEAARPEARLVVLDLNGASFPAVDAVRALKADAATARVEAVGYLSHVMVDLRRQAEAAGCDRVLARSAFVRLLPELLEKARR
ncbi:MAG TPA: response regulator [Candidatus Thermoplasmatota archaeon]